MGGGVDFADLDPMSRVKLFTPKKAADRTLPLFLPPPLLLPPTKKTCRYLPGDRSSGVSVRENFLGRRSEEVSHPATHHSWCWSLCEWSVAAGLRSGLYHYQHWRGGPSVTITDAGLNRLIRFSPCDKWNSNPVCYRYSVMESLKM